jgi:hypothetical protein
LSWRSIVSAASRSPIFGFASPQTMGIPSGGGADQIEAKPRSSGRCEGAKPQPACPARVRRSRSRGTSLGCGSESISLVISPRRVCLRPDR